MLERLDREESAKENVKEESIGMSKTQAGLLTAVFGCWQLNYVEKHLAVRPDIEDIHLSDFFALVRLAMARERCR